jgi:hypothetical protein
MCVCESVRACVLVCVCVCVCVYRRVSMCMNIYLVTLLCCDVLCSCTHACPYPRTRGNQFSRVVADDLCTDERNRDRVAD